MKMYIRSCSVMKFKYRNDTDGLVFYRDDVWEVGDEHETAYPIPSSLGV